MTLALIHTSRIFFTSETSVMDLFDEIMPDVRIINILDDSLLPDCMQALEVTPSLVRRMCAYVVAAEQAGADAILSMCSSLGPAIDPARALVSVPVIKIDDAHTEKAVREHDRIGVLATVETTLRPTVALIREKAEGLGRRVDIRQSLASSAFEALSRGDRSTHDDMLLDAARKLGDDTDVILFAQASMTRLAPRVEQETGCPVLTSPRLAVEYAKRVLDSVTERTSA